MPEGTPDLGAEVALLAEAARAAGAIAMGFFGRDPKTWTKQGNSPVSEADIAADQMLRRHLMAARPEYGWMSEETADTPDRLGRQRLFVVDPIDGTRSFIAGDPGWSVSVAVVEGHRPIAAALYQPATDDMMVAALGRGAWRGATPMRVGMRTDVVGARFAGPRRFFGAQGTVASIGAVLQPLVGSLALRIAHVADDRADAAFASQKAHDWDLAAADLLVHEAGGRLSDIRGETLVYNRPAPQHPALIAAGPGLQAACRDLLGRFVAGSGAPTAA